VFGDVWLYLSSLPGRLVEFREFGHAIGAALALNFGYSILLSFEKFSGVTIRGWVERERDRVTTALAESKLLNKEELDAGSQRVYEIWPWWIGISNLVAIIWAGGAICAAVVLLILLGFDSEVQIRGQTILITALFLYGAVPLGLLACVAFHGCARAHMWFMTKQYNAAIRLISKAPKRAIAKGRRAIRPPPYDSAKQ